jgi:hypothetical protein
MLTNPELDLKMSVYVVDSQITEMQTAHMRPDILPTFIGSSPGLRETTDLNVVH